MEEDRKNEEGDPLEPINGELDPNFAELEKAQNKKLRNKIILWVGITIGVIAVVSLVIILALKSGAGKKKGDDERVIFGNIHCTYDIKQGEINILSDDFENKDNIDIYIGDNKIEFTKKYNFGTNDDKTVKFELKGDKFSLQNMFKNVNRLKIVNMIPETKLKCKITSMESAFEGTKALTEINFYQGFDTSELTSLKNAFANSNIKDIPLNNITLENVVDMSHMFHGSKINNFSPSDFNIKSVQNMQSMFQDSYNLETVVFPNFDSNELNDISYMFAGCDNLQTIDLRNLKTQKVTNMKALFQGCTNLKSLSLSDKFDTSKVADMSFMFDNTISLKNIPVNDFKTESVTNMASMFKDCISVEFLVTSNFVTDKVEDMSYMFSNCNKLYFSNAENFNTGNVKNFDGMFENMA